MQRIAILTVAAALVLTAAPVAAQQGPAPGYDDPREYMADHVEDEADDAASDPIGYAGNRSDPSAVGNASGHAIWWSCWAAWHDAEQAYPEQVCDDYFVPPAQEDAQNPEDEEADDAANGTADEAEQAVGELTEDTRDLADEVEDAVGDTVDDPTSAPEQIRDILAAVVAFVQDRLDDLGGGIVFSAGAVQAGVAGIVDGVAGTVGAAGAGMADGVAATADAAAGAVDASIRGVAGGLQATADGVSASVDAVGRSVDAAVQAIDAMLAGDAPTERANGSQATDTARDARERSRTLLDDVERRAEQTL